MRPDWLPYNCQICQDIWRGLSQSPSHSKFGVKIDLGDTEAAMSTQCGTHRELVRHLAQYQGSSPSLVTRSIQDSGVTVAKSAWKCHWNLLVSKPSVPNHPGVGYILDPHWIDLKFPRKWIENCRSSHGGRCVNPQKVWLARPAWLIDVEQARLVAGDTTNCAYVALSYVYGRQKGFTITAKALARLQQPQVLNNADNDVSHYVAPIVRHAMYLTSIMGERYLWADSLCITHQDPNIMTEQLNFMGGIYAGALVTIVSLDGDAIHGIPGLKGVSRARKANQAVVAFGDEKIVAFDPSSLSNLEGSRYFDRAWTYQEFLLSSRKILLLNDRLHWICQRTCRHEDASIAIKHESSSPTPSQTPRGAGMPRHLTDRLHELGQTVQEYNGKQLRYDEDALPAIAGPLTNLSRAFAGGLLYGIPEMFFEWGLGWTPSNATAELRRRTPSSRPFEDRLHPSGLPSWSWLGWQGDIAMNVRMDHIRMPRADSRSPWFSETIPITEWFTAHSPYDPPKLRHRIKSVWQESYDPFPVLETDETTPPFMPEQTSILFCETWKTRMLGHLDDYNVVTLKNLSGHEVGYLHLQKEEDGVLFQDTALDGEPGLSVELVALCKLRIHSRTRGSQLTTNNEQEKFSVLWVQWRD